MSIKHFKTPYQSRHTPTDTHLTGLAKAQSVGGVAKAVGQSLDVPKAMGSGGLTYNSGPKISPPVPPKVIPPSVPTIKPPLPQRDSYAKAMNSAMRKGGSKGIGVGP